MDLTEFDGDFFSQDDEMDTIISLPPLQPPPPPTHNGDVVSIVADTEADRLKVMSFLNVSSYVADRLLIKYASVEESIQFYFGLSERESAALNDDTESSHGVPPYSSSMNTDKLSKSSVEHKDSVAQIESILHVNRGAALGLLRRYGTVEDAVHAHLQTATQGPFVAQRQSTREIAVQKISSCDSDEDEIGLNAMSTIPNAHVAESHSTAIVGDANEAMDIVPHMTADKTIIGGQATCCLSGVTCDDGVQSVDSFIQLGCGHFYHRGCLAPALRTAIEREVNAKQPQAITCPACVGGNNSSRLLSLCTCGDCNGHTAHPVTDCEMRALVESKECDFSSADYAQWNEVCMAAFLCRESNTGQSVLINCRCGLRISTDSCYSTVTCTCGLKLCVDCKAPSHEGPCANQKAATADIYTQDEGWEMLQSCPFCFALWDRPIDCFHVTCETGALRGGCGEQFCYLCAAPWTPIVNHSNAYHRPQCDLHEECCDKKCITRGATVCANETYRPGPCVRCKDTTRHNACNHTTWAACHMCRKISLNCYHYCKECLKLGKTCTPPVNPSVPVNASGVKANCKIISWDAVKLAEKEDDKMPMETD